MIIFCSYLNPLCDRDLSRTTFCVLYKKLGAILDSNTLLQYVVGYVHCLICPVLWSYYRYVQYFFFSFSSSSCIFIFTFLFKLQRSNYYIHSMNYKGTRLIRICSMFRFSDDVATVTANIYRLRRISKCNKAIPSKRNSTTNPYIFLSISIKTHANMSSEGNIFRLNSRLHSPMTDVTGFFSRFALL